MAVVGQKELSRGVGQNCGEGALDHVDDFGLALGHVQRIGETTLEALALDLRLTHVTLTVGGINRRGQFRRERHDLLVRLALLTVGHRDEDVDQGKEQSEQDTDRGDDPPDSGLDHVAEQQRRNGQEPHDDQPGRRADPAQAPRPLYFSDPLFLGNHASVPSTTASVIARPRALATPVRTIAPPTSVVVWSEQDL